MSMQVCKNCLMDTSDTNITFDSDGICSYCNYYKTNLSRFWQKDENGRAKLKLITDEISNSKLRDGYNCIIGLSGGVDSSYLVNFALKSGLKPLIVHVDAGWNSELAVYNIEKIIKKLNLDLFTVVIDWEAMKNMQLAFLNASVPNQDIPQDHSFFSSLYKVANDFGIKNVLTGSNYASESVLPAAWGYTASDTTHILDVYKHYSPDKSKIKKYPLMSFFKHQLYNLKFKQMKIFEPLNLINYNKESAKETLRQEFDWVDYGGKHCESRFTKFFQEYYLPKKFGFDKRKAHLSSLIIAGQITRVKAESILMENDYFMSGYKEDFVFVAKKLEVSESELSDLLLKKNKSHFEFKTDEHFRNFYYANYRQKFKILIGK